MRDAVGCVVHTTTQAVPTQLAFGRDALLNVSFEADCQCIKKRKKHHILQNNKAKNAARRVHVYQPGDQVMAQADPSRKIEGAHWLGPHAAAQVFEDNSTLQLTKATPAQGGAVSQTWNIRHVKLC